MPNRLPFSDEGDETYRDSDRPPRRGVLAKQSFLHLILEADRPLAGGVRFSLAGIDEVLIMRGRERCSIREQVVGMTRLTVCVPARSLSSVHARLRASNEGWWLEDANSTNGSYLNGQRVKRALVHDSDVIEVGHVFLNIRVCKMPVNEHVADLDSASLGLEPAGLVTLLTDFALDIDRLRRIGVSNLPLTLVGDTGTGKEVLARALHLLSGRAGPFIAVNCAALTQNLVESQLFGHVRGAFSGSIADTPGFIRAAQNGTLLLDEIKELSLPTQAALLRVLQEREVTPVGASRAQPVDVRFIATAPYPLERAVRSGHFRADLLARLTGFVFRIPTLRERREDLGLLIAALLGKAGMTDTNQLPLAPEFALWLVRHAWPLNVRELELLLARATIIADGIIDCEQSSAELEPVPDVVTRELRPKGSGRPPMRTLSAEEHALRERLVAELASSQGNIAQVARAFGKAPIQVHRWMKRFSLQPATFRGHSDRD